MYRSWAILMCVACAVIFGSLASAHAQRIENDIRSVRIGEHGPVTRLVFDSVAPLEYRIFPVYGVSNSIVIELTNDRWFLNGTPQVAGQGVGAGDISGFRYSAKPNQASRILLDISAPVLPVSVFTIEPSRRGELHRLVFDFEPVPQERFTAAAVEASADLAASNDDARVAEADERKVIVIDAGHGGKDPGAIGGKGNREKDVNLKAALKLRDLLKRNKTYEVVLTRADDTYLSLEERVGLARAAEADLFISIHADSAPNKNTSGASVYTLSADAAARVDKVGSEENWIIPIEQEQLSPEVSSILVDLVKRETKTQSEQFAQILIDEMAETGPIVRNSHRRANFFVLLAPDVPAVLLELGFLSNPKDEKRLASDRGITKSVKAIEDAIDLYFENKRILLAQTGG